jgi:hypothetical protein
VLTKEEAETLRLQFATLNNVRGGRRYLPYAFTEHGVAMLSAVLNSARAVQMSILIVRAFVKLRGLAATDKLKPPKNSASILVSRVQDIQRLKNPPITRAIGFVAHSPKKK